MASSTIRNPNSVTIDTVGDMTFMLIVATSSSPVTLSVSTNLRGFIFANGNSATSIGIAAVTTNNSGSANITTLIGDISTLTFDTNTAGKLKITSSGGVRITLMHSGTVTVD